MPDSLNLSTTALFINASDDAEVEIQNGGPGTVYYKTTNDVSVSSYDGTIAGGASLQSRAPKWIVSTTNTKVFIHHTTDAEDTHNVHGVNDFAVIGETLAIDLTASAATQTAAINTAAANLETQGGGLLLLPRTDYTASTGIQVDDPIIIPRSVALRGQGKVETRFFATTADSCIHWNDGEVSDRRGGESGGFTFKGEQIATSCLRFDGVNRSYRDIKVTSPANSGVMYEIGTSGSTNGAQNNSFTNIEGDNEDSSTGIIGIDIDHGSAGCNFSDTQFTFCDTVLFMDNSDSGYATDGPKNITFKGFMWERPRTTTPIIHIKAGRNICFLGGNLAHTWLDNDATWAATPTEYDIVLIDETNSPGRSTQAISFAYVYVQGSLDGSDRYAHGFSIDPDDEMNDEGQWVSVKNCTFQNCLTGFKVGGATSMVIARDNAYQGVSEGVYDSSKSGKPNTVSRSSANTFPTRDTIDFYEISGNTTINTFTATYPGHRITVQFSGAPTVSSSAGNIKLSGLSDMSATADDLLCLICDGSSWHETSRVVK